MNQILQASFDDIRIVYGTQYCVMHKQAQLFMKKFTKLYLHPHDEKVIEIRENSYLARALMYWRLNYISNAISTRTD